MLRRKKRSYSETCLSLRGTVFVLKQSPIRGVGIASPSARNDTMKFLSFRMAGHAMADSQ
jgi:hypothetical protein